ncbi:hypothetical protein BJV78DRAFT_1123532 [Lactifluus subvellereus]|nr:hypothetical protein BJV78DRAFT_1123532 [Lactifluus subvellereus]
MHSPERLGSHLGKAQAASLSDRNDVVNQTMELRNDHGNLDIGTCRGGFVGGNHFRVSLQDGPGANGVALFLAYVCSKRLFARFRFGTDRVVLTADSFVQAAPGLKRYTGVKYKTTQSISGMIPPRSTGIHVSVQIDGIVTLPTVTIVKRLTACGQKFPTTQR